jgi:isoleucyl-tRNA synthetase
VAIALDTVITPELALEGTAREIVKLVQAARRDAGLDVSDRIRLRWASPSPAVAAAFSAHGDWIAAEVLAVEVTSAADGDEQDAAGEPVVIEVSRA